MSFCVFVGGGGGRKEEGGGGGGGGGGRRGERGCVVDLYCALQLMWSILTCVSLVTWSLTCGIVEGELLSKGERNRDREMTVFQLHIHTCIFH